MVRTRIGPCRTAGRWLGAAILLVAAAPAFAADSFRCGGHIVERGDRAIRVEALCGPPSLVEHRPVESVYGYGVDGVETWTYNFGPRKLLRVLTLRNGRVSDISSDGYGFLARDKTASTRAKSRCNPYDLAEGMTSFRVLDLCGPPDDQQQVQVFVPLTPKERARYPHLRHSKRQVQREEWTYNFGRDHLIRTLTLENGRVRHIDVGERGFGP